MQKRFALAAFVAIGFLASPLVGRADEAEASAAIKKILEVGWSTSPGARTAADRVLVEVTPAITGDLRALEAWTLVLLYQRRYDEASKRIDQWLAKDGDDWMALRARVWLFTVVKNYPAAMLSAEKLADKIAATEDSTSPGAGEQLNELAAFLGRIYGYIGGPVAASVPLEDRRSSEKRIADRLGEQRAAAFVEARDNVLQQHLELTDSKTEKRDEARDAIAAEREKTLAEIAAQREQLTGRSNELKNEQSRLRSEMKGELEELQKQDRPLATQFARIDAQARGVNSELGRVATQIDRLELDASRQNDPVARERLLREADRLNVLASRLDREFRTLESQAALVQHSELDGMAKREKRLAADKVRAKRPISGTTSEVLALGAQASALSTYDTLPLEAAKEALLKSLR
jgi:hypothetical protein